MKKVAIIGAGLTGLTIAQELNAHFDVTVFEKSRGVGGRIATRRTDGFEFDHGAQFFTAKSDLFKKFIKPLIDSGVIACWDARFVELNDSKIINEIAWDESFPHYVGKPSMNVICKHLAKNLNIRLNTRINVIKPENNWQLYDENDTDLGIYDWVIITAPPEQTLQLMPTSFKYFQNMQSVKMLGCYSLMLGFDNNPLPNFDAAVIQNSTISWISVNNSKPARADKPTLLINSTNDWAEKNMDNDPNIVINLLAKELQKVSGVDIRDAKCQILHRWRYANINNQKNHQGLIDFDQKLAACGDWCITGRVESAFLVGHAVAKNILANINW